MKPTVSRFMTPVRWAAPQAIAIARGLGWRAGILQPRIEVGQRRPRAPERPHARRRLLRDLHVRHAAREWPARVVVHVGAGLRRLTEIGGWRGFRQVRVGGRLKQTIPEA